MRGRARPSSTTLDALPDEYLLLRTGRRSSFARRGQAYSLDGGPFELRLVGDGRDDLLAVWYRARDPRPTAPPLLTLFGWYRGANGVDGKVVDAALVRFLTDALATGRRS